MRFSVFFATFAATLCVANASDSITSGNSFTEAPAPIDLFTMADVETETNNSAQPLPNPASTQKPDDKKPEPDKGTKVVSAAAKVAKKEGDDIVSHVTGEITKKA